MIMDLYDVTDRLIASKIVLNMARIALILSPMKIWRWVKQRKEFVMRSASVANGFKTRITISQGVLIFLLTITLFAAAAGNSLAASYYVATNGSDSNNGSIGSPWRNPWVIATKTFSAGDTIYIRAGTYTITDQSWIRYNCPNIHVRQSGSVQNPVTIRNYPGETAILNGTANSLGPVIGVCQDYPANNTVIDGLEITNGGLRVEAAQNVVIQNNIIHGITAPFCDNVGTIWVEWFTNATIRNNKLYDVNNSCGDANASAIIGYRSTNVTIENNEIYNSRAGIHLKTGGNYNRNYTIRNNYMHDLAIYAIGISFADNDDTNDIKVYNNIMASTGTGFKMDSGADSGVASDWQVYNNTIYGYIGNCLVGPASAGSTNWKGYNNICSRTGSASRDGIQNSALQISILDYNLYYKSTGLSFQLGGANYTTLANWRTATGKEANSLGGTTSGFDPLFVGPLTSAAGFKLSSGSPALNAGRSDGTSGGSVVHIGAYRTGNECIGLESHCSILSDTAPPYPPSGLRVQ